MKGVRSQSLRPWRRLTHRRRGDDGGFALVEIIAASVILMAILISFSNLLVDSLSAALIARQREAAASIASDTIENAKALGQTSLTAAPTSAIACPVPSGTTGLVNATPVPVLTSATFTTPYLTTAGSTVFTVCSTVSAPASTADLVKVVVAWSSGHQSFATSTQVGS